MFILFKWDHMYEFPKFLSHKDESYHPCWLFLTCYCFVHAVYILQQFRLSVEAKHRAKIMLAVGKKKKKKKGDGAHLMPN